MLPRQRQAHILDRVRQHGAARVTEMAAALDVSDMTIRRDIESLARQGLVERVHGGATAIHQGTAFEPAFETKAGLHQAEKAAIATRAAREIQPGSAIGIGAGTTTHALAPHLTNIPGLTLVTNSVPVSDHLVRHGRNDQTVILTGGVRTRSEALVGPLALHALRTVHLDLVFLGVYGMDGKSGFTTPNHLEADTDRALISSGRRLIVCADHTKWGQVGISSIAALTEADMIISDDQLADEARDELEQHTRVVTAVLETETVRP
jgi:DeoR/GlpR family transcriptional regulator of sugar metabolism